MFSALEDMSRIFHLFFLRQKRQILQKRVLYEQNHQHMATDCRGLYKLLAKLFFSLSCLKRESCEFCCPQKTSHIS